MGSPGSVTSDETCRSAERQRETLDLPEAMPPVRPRIFMGCSGFQMAVTEAGDARGVQALSKA